MIIVINDTISTLGLGYHWRNNFVSFHATFLLRHECNHDFAKSSYAEKDYILKSVLHTSMEVLGICVRKSKGPGTFTFAMYLYFASVIIDQGLQARSKVYVGTYVLMCH